MTRLEKDGFEDRQSGRIPGCEGVIPGLAESPSIGDAPVYDYPELLGVAGVVPQAPETVGHFRPDVGGAVGPVVAAFQPVVGVIGSNQALLQTVADDAIEIQCDDRFHRKPVYGNC
ncbi:hypothetical protein ES703_125544 [subsurface metagenome]